MELHYPSQQASFIPCVCSWQESQIVPSSGQVLLEREISAQNVPSPSHHVLQDVLVDVHCNKGRISPGSLSGKHSLHNIPNADARKLRKQLFVYFIQAISCKRWTDFREGHQTQSVTFCGSSL